MIYDVDVVSAGQVGHFDLVGQKKPAVDLQAHQWSGLAAQILGDIGQVDSPLAGLKQSTVEFMEKIKQVPQDRVGDFGVAQQVFKRLFHAAHGAVDQEWLIPSAKDNPAGIVIVQLFCNAGKIEVIDARPAMTMHILW